MGVGVVVMSLMIVCIMIVRFGPMRRMAFGCVLMPLMIVFILSGFHTVNVPDGADGHQNGAIPRRARWLETPLNMIDNFGVCVAAFFR